MGRCHDALDLRIELFLLLLLLLRIGISYGSDLDISCLRSIKHTMEDPNGNLDSWDFTNESAGFVCKFVGINCWNNQGNRIIGIFLTNMGLKGVFPRGLVNCTYLTTLDLSFNDLSGELPSDISKLVPYVTTLRLSSNSFSGEIPRDLSNCIYLNYIQLNDNMFSGQIPAEIGYLSRLVQFNVANNDLDGLIPMSMSAKFPADSFANNLFGSPESPLPPRLPLVRTPEFLTGAAISGLVFSVTFFTMGIYFFFYRIPRTPKKGAKGSKCARRIAWTRIKVSKSESSLADSEFRQLMKATNNFSKKHIIGFGNAGTITLYRAALKNGKVYTVKRLHYTSRLLKECALKMTTMGSVRHPNLVPLLGYCVANKELFSVYEHMPNGSLYDQLHSSAGDCGVRMWPLIRLDIAVGAARGLACLHHYCNPRIIHQNISSRCILLDADFMPKVSDFGLVRLKNPTNDEHLGDSVKTEQGDSGYLAPEHGGTNIETPKRDVYNFGVVLLELITGETPTCVAKPHNGFNGRLVEWVMQLSNKSDLKAAVDRQLVGKGFDDELIEFLKIACSCVASNPSDRPSMLEVHLHLTAILDRHHFLSASSS